VPLDDFGCPIDAVAKYTGDTEQILNVDFREHRATPAIPMPGYLMGRIIHDETMELMNDLGIGCISFLFEDRVQASYPGGLRPALTWPKSFSFSPVDSLHWRLSFFLKKGSYATVLLRELLKPKNPFRFGF